MKPFLAAALVLGLLLVLPVAASSHDEWPKATPVLLAQGKAHYRLYDAATGVLLCANSALVVVERDVDARLAWTAPSCEGTQGPMLRHFPGCALTRDAMTCAGSDRSGGDALALARWGAFHYRGGAVDGTRVEMEGQLTVLTWAMAL